MTTPNEHVLAGRVRVAAAALRWSYVGSSGPGGQNVNQRATQAQLHVAISDLIDLPLDAAQRLRGLAQHLLTNQDELLLTCQKTRSQGQNRELVLEQLRGLVARALVRPVRRVKTKPTRGSERRRLEDKKRTAQRKSDRRGE